MDLYNFYYNNTNLSARISGKARNSANGQLYLDVEKDNTLTNILLVDDAGIDVTGAITATGTLTIENDAPGISLNDTGDNPDWQIKNENGLLRVRDTTASINRLTIASGGQTVISGNLDCSSGVDVTGNITVTGTVDGVDIAALNTTVGNITTDVVSDTSPQLGGDLATNNGNDIHLCR